MLKQLMFVSVLSVTFMGASGCGGVTEGVADAPDEPAPELTPDEEAGEKEYTTSEEYSPH